MKYLNTFLQINELKKAYSYIDRTSSPYTDKGDMLNSRFVEYSDKSKQGWELVGMQEIDKDGEEIGERYIKTENFIYDYSLSDYDFSVLKKVITAAFGEIANQNWIEDFKFESNKAYASILLGKIGMVFTKNNDTKYYTPILKYPSGREGNTFWLSAEFEKGEQWARTVIITKPDISDNELEHNGIALLQSTYYKYWETENEKRRREERPLLPKTAVKKVNAVAYVNSNVIVRETGEKQFFIVYVQGSKYDPIAFARKACGANITLSSTRFGAISSEEKSKKIYNKNPKYFFFNPDDNPKNSYLLKKYKNNPDKLKETKDLIGRLIVFLYQNPETNKFEYAIINRAMETNKSLPYKDLELMHPKNTNNKFNFEIKSGTKLKIPSIDEKNPDKIIFHEVTVGSVDSKDNKKVRVY